MSLQNNARSPSAPNPNTTNPASPFRLPNPHQPILLPPSPDAPLHIQNPLPPLVNLDISQQPQQRLHNRSTPPFSLTPSASPHPPLTLLLLPHHGIQDLELPVEEVDPGLPHLVCGAEGLLDLEDLIVVFVVGRARAPAAIEGPGAEIESDFGDVDDGLVDVYEEFFVRGADEDFWCV